MPEATQDVAPKFGACTFFAKSHPGETCGSNGLPLTPNSITILGRSQRLKTIDHPNLSTYLDVIRGKHERIITVAEYTGTPLSEINVIYTTEEKLHITKQIIDGIFHLHTKNITHRNLSTDNILIDSNNNVMLFNYGLYYMTGDGKDVSFPIGQPRYLSPETILGGGGPSCDVWNLGIIIMEIFLGPLWAGLKPGNVLRRIMTLLQTPNPAQRIAREHDTFEAYQELPENLQNLIESCLKISPRERLSLKEVMEHIIFEDVKSVTNKRKVSGLLGCDMSHLYYWWQLAGGDICAELKKQGLIKNNPLILSMPIAVLLDGGSLGGQSLAPLDRRVAISGIELLVSRLGHVPPIHYLPLADDPPSKCYETSQLPRIIRERDTEYQFHRLILFKKLLRGYPFTEKLIKKEAAIDIPPLVRGEVWAALLGIKGDIEDQYVRIDKETPTTTDRQIDVDIPRCHQYCWLLCGNAGHCGLRRILKAWLISNPQYVYWQGLDSLSAPFLYLNFNNEARAFACLSTFVPRYLHKFFLKDNSAVIKEYLAKFWQLAAYHEPKLATHLYNIEFVPELFAIPWFLTMFSHVFPLHKILHLWDALLVKDGSLPLYMGVAILRQLRDTLLASGFNECILLFSDLPEIDIEQCVNEAIAMYDISPKSISFRKHENDIDLSDSMSAVDIESTALFKEICPRISCNDFLKMLKDNSICIVDIRSIQQFNQINVEGSINIQTSSVQYSDHSLSSLGLQADKDIKAAIKNNLTFVIIYSDIEVAQLFSEHLVRCEVPRVCILHGGINILHSVSPPILRSYC